MNTTNLNEIWRDGRNHVVTGGKTSDNPCFDMVRKRAWIIGFKAGLEILKGKLPR